jgi:hypothetical protein
MRFFGREIKVQINRIQTKSQDTLPVTLEPSTYRGFGSDFWFFGSDGVDYKFTYSGHESSLKAYQKCSPLTAIINRKAQAHINGKTWVMNTRGKEAQGKEADKLRKLLAKPNPLQSWKQFEAQQKIYIQLFGWCLVLPIIPVGYEKYGPIEASSLWNIPPYMVDIEETNKLFYQTDMTGIIKQIVLKYKNQKQIIPANNIYIFKDFTPSINSLIFPETRICSLSMSINNIIASLESCNELINYAGSQGIITPDNGGGQLISVPLNPDEKKELQEEFKRQYGIRKGQYRYIISPAAVKWQQMGMRPKDLALREGVTEDSKMICDGYGYPPHLLGLIDPSFNNQSTAEKGLYQNTIIPEAESMYEEWNNFFRLSEYNIKLEKDYSHLPILQADATQLATARRTWDEALKLEFDAGLITLNDWLIKLGEDPLPGDLGNVRSTDPKSSNIPFGLTMSVGAIQGLISVITAQGMSAEARQATLEVLFGISPQDAARMATESVPPTTLPITNQPADA